jgi:photosystem II stability/assembly factor-like uncharacterized protein
MKTLKRPLPPGSENRAGAEALEPLIEEARQRARRRRRGYAALALVAVVAAPLGFFVFSDGGGATQTTDGRLQPAPGLEGGRISAFAVDPQHPDTVFAATFEGGVFKSANGAQTWRPLDLGPGVSRVDTLAIAPGDPKTLYAGTGHGVFKTTDGGRSWQATSSDLLGNETAERREHRSIEGYVYTLTVDQSDADIAYAGTWQNGVFKTEDGGRSWQSIGPKAVAVSTLALNPQDTGTIYAGALGSYTRGGPGVIKSSDSGATWHPVGLRGTDVATLALDPKHPETVFAGTLRKGIFKSTNGGASWRSVGLEGEASSALVLDPNNSGIAYAGMWDRGVFKTEDGGRSWRSLEAGASSSALALNPRDPGIIYAGRIGGLAEGGVLKSLDAGQSWRPMNAGLIAARVSALALDPGSQGTAYAAVDGRGVFKRVDERWRAATTGLTSEWVHALAVDPQDPATVYAGTDGPVYKSTDGAASWGVASLLHEPTGVSALAVDPQDSATVYAITTNDATGHDGRSIRIRSRVFKSTDGGSAWPTEVVVQAVKVLGARGAVIDRAVHNPSLVIDPLDPEVLYAGGLGVTKSFDGGMTWRSSGLPRRPVPALAVDPEKAGIVYAGTDAGLFKSTDAGASWQPLHGPLDGVRVETVAIDTEHNRTLYAGTERGVFWSADGGYRWRRFARLPLRSFDALAVDRASGVVHAGAYGGGIYELQLAR